MSIAAENLPLPRWFSKKCFEFHCCNQRCAGHRFFMPRGTRPVKFTNESRPNPVDILYENPRPACAPANLYPLRPYPAQAASWTGPPDSPFLWRVPTRPRVTRRNFLFTKYFIFNDAFLLWIIIFYKTKLKSIWDGFEWFTLWLSTSTHFSSCSFKNIFIFDELHLILLDEQWLRDEEIIVDERSVFDEAVLSSDSSGDKSCNSIILRSDQKFWQHYMKI